MGRRRPRGTRVELSGEREVTSVAGDGVAGDTDGTVADARFCAPSDVALGADGTIYVADTGNNTIRTISIDGDVGTLAGGRRVRGGGRGGAPESRDGDADHATFAGPVALALDEAQARLFVVDGDTDAVRCIVLPPSPSGDPGRRRGRQRRGPDYIGSELNLSPTLIFYSYE